MDDLKAKSDYWINVLDAMSEEELVQAAQFGTPYDIGTTGTAKDLFVWRGKTMIFSGLGSYLPGKEHSIFAYQVVKLKDYVGDLDPLEYEEHIRRAVLGWPGLKFICKGQSYVVLGPEHRLYAKMKPFYYQSSLF